MLRLTLHFVTLHNTYVMPCCLTQVSAGEAAEERLRLNDGSRSEREGMTERRRRGDQFKTMRSVVVGNISK